MDKIREKTSFFNLLIVKYNFATLLNINMKLNKRQIESFSMFVWHKKVINERRENKKNKRRGVFVKCN